MNAIRIACILAWVIAGFMFVSIGAAFVTSAMSGPSVRQHPAAVCHFDGGGTIAAGNAARTTDGNVWECGEDGTLTELSASVRPLRPAVHPSLPSWVHWRQASSGAARQVCGKGVQAITVWGGNGDTTAVVCANGKAETS